MSANFKHQISPLPRREGANQVPVFPPHLPSPFPFPAISPLSQSPSLFSQDMSPPTKFLTNNIFQQYILYQSLLQQYHYHNINWMKIALALLVILSVVSAFSITKEAEQVTGVAWPFAVCGNGTWTMKNLTLSKAPSRNAEDAVDAFGVANSQTEFSKVDIVVKLNGLFLHSETVDFDRAFDSGDVIEYEYKTFIPSFAPAGTYVMSFTFKTPSNKQNGCWSFSFKL